MTEKEGKVYQKMIDFYKENKTMPSVRDIQKELDYKSQTTIYKVLKTLEDKGYLKRNKKKKFVFVNNIELEQKEFVIIKVINTKEELLLNLNIRKKYIAYKIKNNYFNHFFIKENDYLIIEKTKDLNNNDLGLFIIDNKYRILLYSYYDGFYLLKDYETITLYRIKIVGKVISVYRKNIC